MLRVLQIMSYPQVRCQLLAISGAMSIATAVLYFDVEGLEVHSDLLGTRHSSLVDGHTCTLIFPRDQNDFDNPSGSNHVQLFDGWTEVDGQRVRYRVRWVKVEVEIPCDLTAADFPAGASVGERDWQVFDILKAATRIASDFVGRVMRQVNVTYKQYWLGPTVKQFEHGWRGAYLVDRNGERIPLNLAVSLGRVAMHPNAQAPTGVEFEALVHGVGDGGDAVMPLAETLLVDALRASEDLHPDLRVATLLAAVACEVKIKQAMRRLATPEQEALVSALLENPHDWSMAANELFNKGIKAVCGRSMRDEDRPLWNAVKLLFTERNKIAHKGGEGLNEDILKDHCKVANRAFVWVDGVIADASQPWDGSASPASPTP
jgi:hypothetical protein